MSPPTLIPRPRSKLPSLAPVVASLFMLAILLSSCADSPAGLGTGLRLEGSVLVLGEAPEPGVLGERAPLAGVILSLSRDGRTLSTTSVGSGHFEFQRLTAGTWTLAIAASPGFVLPPDAPATREIMIAEGGSPTVMVELAPAEDAAVLVVPVTLDSLNPAPGVPFQVETEVVQVATGTTSEDGFVVFSVAPGLYDVVMTIPDGLHLAPGAVSRATVVAEAGGSHWLSGFALTSVPPSGDATTAAVFGRAVVDDGLAPVPGVAIELRGTAGSRSSTTGEDGSFLLDEVPPGDWELIYSPPSGYLLADGQTSGLRLAGLRAGERVYVDIGLAGADGTGSLLVGSTSDSLPLAGVQVRVRSQGAPDILTSGTTSIVDTGASRVLFDLSPGSYEVEAIPPAGHRMAEGEAPRTTVQVRRGRLSSVHFLLVSAGSG